jgi:MFS transporter, SHS family, lactate transporter
MAAPSEGPWWREPTRAQWTSFLAAWAGWVLDGFDFTIFLLVLPQIAAEFGVSLTLSATSITLTLLMRLLGGAVAGILADRYGRKLPLMLSILWFAACDGAVAFAPSFTWVLVLRTLFGFGMGAEWAAGTTLALENWPKRSRGLAGGILQGSFPIGYLLAAAVAHFVVPLWGWRALFLIAVAPALLVLPIRFWVPESPEWKAHAGEREKPRGPLPRGIWLNLLWSSVLISCGFGVYYALTGLWPTALRLELGQSQSHITSLVMLFNVGSVVGSCLWGYVATRRGPIFAIAVPALLALPFFPLYVGAVSGGLALGAFFAGCFGVGHAGVSPLLLTSLFPPHIRGRSIGIVYHVGAFVAALVPVAVAALGEHTPLSLGQSIVLVAGVFEVLVVVSLALRPLSARRSSVDVGMAGGA